MQQKSRRLLKTSSGALALAYSQRHPERVSELILQGIFLLRKREIDWFYQYGASALYPDPWEPYASFIPEAKRSDMLSTYYRRLTSDDPPCGVLPQRFGGGGRVQLQNFFRMRLSLPTTKRTSSLRSVSRIRHTPAVIVLGHYDVVCPMEAHGRYIAYGPGRN